MSAVDYNEQVAELIADACGFVGSTNAAQVAIRDRKVQAARALAALEVGKQAAVRNLLLVATVPDSLGANLALRREAFMEAARILGLVDEHDNDPADLADELKGADHGN